MMINHILQGDVLDCIELIDRQSINCIVTSPPYFGLRDYGLPPTNWPEVTYAPMAGLPPLIVPPMTCCLGLEDSIEAYVGHMILVFRGLWDVLRGDGVAWLNLGDSYFTSTFRGVQNDFGSSTLKMDGRRESSRLHSLEYAKSAGKEKPNKVYTSEDLKPKNLCGIPWRCAFALQAEGWYLRSDIIWHKKNPMPESVTDRPTKAHEYLFLLAKNGAYWYDQEAIRENFADERMGNPGKYTPHYNIGSQRNDGNQIGANGEWDGSKLGGRNKRTVWTIATKPYKAAHFAVMPEALVEPCLLAGCPPKVCAECGEPWTRVVERDGHNKHHGINKTYQDQAKGAHGKTSMFRTGQTNKTKTLGFAPTCQCSAPTYPGVALDPFFGAGTVGVVAQRLGRRWLGVELNEAYVALAQERISKTKRALFPL